MSVAVDIADGRRLSTEVTMLSWLFDLASIALCGAVVRAATRPRTSL